MALFFMTASLLPALYGVMITGDFSQYVYKPSRGQIYTVLTKRSYLVTASMVLWLGGLLVHLYYTPVVSWIVFVTLLLLLLFNTAAFLMSGYILFRGLHQPQWIPAAQAGEHLNVNEPVIGLEINGDARAYPVDTILRPHLVIDEIGGQPVTMTYCMLSNSAMAFKPQMEGQALDFITPLQWENNLMLYDTSGEYLVQQLTGTVVGGDSDGLALQSFPTRIMPWSAWQQLHPQTKVLYHPAQSLFDRLVRTMLRTKIHEPNQRQSKPVFPTISHFDDRLPNKTQVLGVCINDKCKAYPLKNLREKPLINDSIAGQPLLVAYDLQNMAADVFRRTLGEQTLTFSLKTVASGTFVMQDKQTSSTWDMTGSAIDGPLAGSRLDAVVHFSRVYWFVWINFHPHSELAS